jgi:predicted phage terminase large subunit-like protein
MMTIPFGRPSMMKQHWRIKQNISSADWAALYCQSPIALEGQFFKEEWLIPTLDIPPSNRMRLYGASDFAVTQKGGDYTVHVVLGLDSQMRLYMVDMWRRQASSADWVDSFCDLVQKWHPAFWSLEKGQITAGVGPFLRQRMRERKAYTSIEEFPVRYDKAVRAQSIRGRAELRGVYYPARASWRDALMGEWISFPTGRHDDIIDALGLAGQLIDKWSGASLPGANVVKIWGPKDFKDYAIADDEGDRRGFMTL